MKNLLKAERIIVEEQKASVQFLQKRLMISHSEALELLTVIENRNIIGRDYGSEPRKIFITAEEYKLLKIDDNTINISCSEFFIDNFRTNKKAIVMCREHGKVWDECESSPNTCSICIQKMKESFN